MKSSIIHDLESSYGLICGDTTPVTGGWLNEKWKVSTNNSPSFLMKTVGKQLVSEMKFSG